MLLDLDILREHLFLILAATLTILLLKVVANSLSTFLIGFPMHTMILVGFSLSQVGEFSFILAKVGFTSGLISSLTYQEFMDVAVLSMVLTPLFMSIGYRTTNFAELLPFPPILKQGWYSKFQENESEEKLENHVIIVGFGINGRNVATAAKATSIPYIVIDMNPEVVRVKKLEGEHIFYGDAAQSSVLEHAGIYTAKSIVVTAGDPASAKRIIEVARRLNPQIHIIARTHFLSELDKFYAFGADEVISDEFESSIELFTRVLHRYLVPSNEINSLGLTLRADHYEMLRNPDRSIRVGKLSKIAGMTLGELDLRKKYGVSVLAISRFHKIIPGPEAGTEILADDILLVISPPEELDEVRKLCEDSLE